MVIYFVEEFKWKYGKNIFGNSRLFRRLKIVCERVKRIFFSSLEISIELDVLYEGIDFYSKFFCVIFEEFCSKLFFKILEFVKKVLFDVELELF